MCEFFEPGIPIPDLCTHTGTHKNISQAVFKSKPEKRNNSMPMIKGMEL